MCFYFPGTNNFLYKRYETQTVSFLNIWAILEYAVDYSSHTFGSLTTGWRFSRYPEEAVRGALRSQTALHTWRELVPPANSKVIIIVTGLLSEHGNMTQDIQ